MQAIHLHRLRVILLVNGRKTPFFNSRTTFSLPPEIDGRVSSKNSMKRTASICFSCAAVLVLWSLPVLVCAGKSQSFRQIPTFDKIYSDFQRLSKNPSSTRDEWQNVIKAFLALRQAQKGELSNRSLLCAGRASLALYKRSRKTEDLETALIYLKQHGELSKRSSLAAIGARELKTAQSIHSTVIGSASKRDDAPAQSSPSSVQGPTLPANQIRGVLQPADPTASTVSQLRSSLPTRGVATSSGESFCPVPQGNPYFGCFNRPAAKAQGHIRSASVPSSTMSDGLRLGSVAKKSRCFVVVIDPGHGGKDPGAVSQDGRIKEKDLTLDIAKRLRSRLEKSIPGSRIILTRNDDTGLTLSERTSLANSVNADLFLSIHGNGFGDSRAKGIETFYLSKANSRGSMRVAARENGISLAKMSDLEATLVDLMVTSKKTESDTVANTVHGSLVENLLPRDPSTRDRGVKTAPFYVLLGAKMPSILVECAFVTNSRDRNRLGSLNYLDLIADGIAVGTVKYLKGLDEKA